MDPELAVWAETFTHNRKIAITNSAAEICRIPLKGMRMAPPKRVRWVSAY
jgi:hypothetical protein